METVIAAPNSCDVRAVIRCVCAEGKSAVEIHRRLCRVYGDNIMSDFVCENGAENAGMSALICMTKVVKNDTQL
jgi:hypothetical protein